MKPKKSKKANLENLRTIFFQVGMILTLSAILVAFEWKSSIKIEEFTNKGISWIDIEELPPVTRPEPENLEVKPPTPIEKLIIVGNEVEIKDPPILIDEESFEDQQNWDNYFDNDPEEIDEPLVRAQFMPTFQGKDGSYFRNYVANTLKFPDSAIESGVTGTVFASFVIDEKGKVIKTRITRSVHPVIDKAVLEAINNSPRWEPGINNGKYVRVKYSIAIAFQLQ